MNWKQVIMIGSFITGDYYFFFDKTTLYWLEKGQVRVGSFVCNSNKERKLLRMPLNVQIDTGTEKEPPRSSIDLDFKENVCRLNISKDNFREWFLEPSEHVKLNGPNWRFASCNVYIKTEESQDSETFSRIIQNLLQQVPEPRHPQNRKAYQKIKKKRSKSR